jgi:riboflavin synthase
MFTGLIETLGAIRSVDPTPAGRRIAVDSSLSDLTIGESVAVNGVCLTVLERDERIFTAAAVQTTVERTAIGSWKSGQLVNLERALRPNDRLGGHIVQGHIDGVGRVIGHSYHADTVLLTMEVPPEVFAFSVAMGSIAVDGVSLTVHELQVPYMLRVSLIEFTRKATTLGDARLGTLVNLEADVIAKYVHRLAGPYAALPPN